MSVAIARPRVPPVVPYPAPCRPGIESPVIVVSVFLAALSVVLERCPDEAHELASHGGHHLPLRLAAFAEGAIALMEPLLGAVCDRDRARWLPLPPLSESVADSGAMSVVPCGLDQESA